MRIVLDTNIVMDLLHFGDRHTHPLKTAIQAGRVQCFTDAECLAELERVTGYPEFGLPPERQRLLLETYRSFALSCEAQPHENFFLPRCRDPDDQKFLILAARCQADLLVTRDKLLLKLARHRRIPPPFSIMTAETACQLLGPLPTEDPARLA